MSRRMFRGFLEWFAVFWFVVAYFASSWIPAIPGAVILTGLLFTEREEFLRGAYLRLCERFRQWQVRRRNPLRPAAGGIDPNAGRPAFERDPLANHRVQTGRNLAVVREASNRGS